MLYASLLFIEFICSIFNIGIFSHNFSPKEKECAKAHSFSDND